MSAQIRYRFRGRDREFKEPIYSSYKCSSRQYKKSQDKCKCKKVIERNKNAALKYANRPIHS